MGRNPINIYIFNGTDVPQVTLGSCLKVPLALVKGLWGLLSVQGVPNWAAAEHHLLLCFYDTCNRPKCPTCFL